MNTGKAQMMAMANSFWPIAYSLKSYDLSLHSALLASNYRSIPALPFEQVHVQAEAKTSAQKCNSNSFSIDAILNNDIKPEPQHSYRNIDDNQNCDRQLEDTNLETNFSRRQQRLLEVAHPYLGHAFLELQNQHAYQHHERQAHSQLSAAYSHVTKCSSTADTCEKKTGLLTQSWNKQSKNKRVRTIFTPEQLERMEAEFERQQYMVGTERFYLASSLNLTEAQVKVWFQNRRIKWRKQHLELQKAKLASMDIYKDANTGSNSESDEEGQMNIDAITQAESFSDHFRNAKEQRGTQ